MTQSNLFGQMIQEFQDRNSSEEISLLEFLDLCKNDPTAYASPQQRMLTAIGEPESVDTKHDQRLSKIFGNRVIRRYPAFKDFYGIEDTVEQLVSYFKHASQGLEEHKQILYLLGPVGSAKSTIAEKLKELMENIPFYAIKGSPVFEDPLGLFDRERYGSMLEKEYGIPITAIRTRPSPWAVEKLKEYNGDISQFRVVKIYPSRLKQQAIARIEPSDENNQDVSTMVGKLDIRKLEDYEQSHPYAYSYSGGLCFGNRGIVEMVEIFKAPLKTLNPLLTATQDKLFVGTESIGAIPFDGIILAHSNESEWKSFRNDKKNEAFIDRLYIVKVPYCLRVYEETQIYEKMIRHSNLATGSIAPGTLDMLAKFAVMTRLVEPENSTLYTKLRVYNGDSTVRDDDPRAKPLQEYRDAAGVGEGMDGISTRFAFKVLSKVFNYDNEEVAANPIHLMLILENEIIKEQFDQDRESSYLSYLKDDLADKYLEFAEKDIRQAFLESYGEMCQTVFENYLALADHWLQDNDYRDPDTGVLFNRNTINQELEKIEKPANIINAKEFRGEIVNLILRQRANNNGEMPRWNAYEKIARVIESKILASTDELLPIISFAPKRSTEEQEKHDKFLNSMLQRGYTNRQARLVVEWYQRMKRSS